MKVQKSSVSSAIGGFFAGIWAAVKDAVYVFRVWLHEKTHNKNPKKKKSLGNVKRKDLIFYCLILAYPVAQFCIFYIGVNFNSFLLAFREYNYMENSWSFVGWANFERVFWDLFASYELVQSMKNSLILYVWGLIVGVPLALLFSYYIYKKLPLGGLFKVMLFLPSVISSIAMVLMFKYFVENAYPEMAELITGTRPQGLIANPNTAFATILFYTIWAGFGTSILMYSGAMNSISDSVVEAAKIEGAGAMREFFSITLPLIYPTIVTFLVVGIAGIFTNQMNLFSFKGTEADLNLYTFGYYLYKNTQESVADMANYSYLSAMGLVMTIVAVPVTLVVRWLLNKLGPSTE